MAIVTIGPGGVTVTQDWTTFKTYVNGTVKSLVLQYVDEGNDYLIFAIDGRTLYHTILYKAGFEPAGYSAGQISQNTSDVSDFTINFQPTANKQTELLAGSNVKHYNGTATTGNITITLNDTSKSLFIQNMDSTNNLLISFDAGSTFKTILAGSTLAIDVVISSFIVKSSASTVAYESLVVS